MYYFSVVPTLCYHYRPYSPHPTPPYRYVLLLCGTNPVLPLLPLLPPPSPLLPPTPPSTDMYYCSVVPTLCYHYYPYSPHPHPYRYVLLLRGTNPVLPVKLPSLHSYPQALPTEEMHGDDIPVGTYDWSSATGTPTPTYLLYLPPPTSCTYPHLPPVLTPTYLLYLPPPTSCTYPHLPPILTPTYLLYLPPPTSCTYPHLPPVLTPTYLLYLPPPTSCTYPHLPPVLTPTYLLYLPPPTSCTYPHLPPVLTPTYLLYLSPPTSCTYHLVYSNVETLFIYTLIIKCVSLLHSW